jgi:putative hydroxymethylpyrimidine transport system substrate-binding protein
MSKLVRLRPLGARLPLALLLVALATGVAACGDDSESSSGGGSDKPYDLTLELDWQPGTSHTGVFVAEQEGLFDEQNVKVKRHSPSDATAPLKFVGTDKVDLAISYEPEVIIAAAEGLPVTAVGPVIPTPLASFVAGHDSGIESPADAAGKRVGYSGIPKEEAMARAIFEEAGISIDDVEMINVGFNLLPATLSGKIDAMLGAFRNGTAVEYEQETGKKPLVVAVDEAGVPSYDELVFVANSKRLADDEDYRAAVEGFLAAYAEAIAEIEADPEVGFEALKVALSNTLEDEEKLRGEWDATAPLLVPQGDRKPGCFDTAEWDEFSSWMQEQGLIDEAVPAADVVTNDHGPDC